MLVPLQETVSSAAVGAGGWIVGLAGVGLAVAWLNHLYR